MSISMVECLNCGKSFITYVLYVDDGKTLVYPPCSSCGKAEIKRRNP